MRRARSSEELALKQLALRGGGKLAFRFLLNAAVAALGRRTAFLGRRRRIGTKRFDHLEQLCPRCACVLLAAPLHL